MVDKIGPVPSGVTAGAPSGEIPSILEWFNNVIDRLQRSASTTQEGSVKQSETQSDSTAATVTDLRDDFNALLAKLKASGQMDS